ncbi:hypothetical protein HK101_011007 [Irineochytrium annulatum]|nr:hypothetical protein HK101_011007 [Irineochytrium annulatum]
MVLRLFDAQFCATGHIATVFGCTGFLGRYLVNVLGRRGTQVVTPYRGIEDERRDLKLMGDLGQIVQLRFDLRNEDQIVECLRHSDTVYNLIGKKFPTKNFSLESVHVDGARRLARLAREAGVSKFIHCSALGADVNSSSRWMRTKALGEIAVREEFPSATIIRQATQFGMEDKFWNMMGFYSRICPIGFPIANGGKTIMRPVYVNDVAVAMGSLLSSDIADGRIVELYGPRTYTYKQLVDYFLDISKRNPTVWYAPKFVGKAIAGIVNRLTFSDPFFSPDEVDRLYIDENPQDPNALHFEDLGVHPMTIEETMMRFAAKYRPDAYQRMPYEPDLKKYMNNPAGKLAK